MEITGEQLLNEFKAGIDRINAVFMPQHAYSAKHIPSGEEWWIVGINRSVGKCLVAGWQNTIAPLCDMTDWEVQRPITDNERDYCERKLPHQID